MKRTDMENWEEIGEQVKELKRAHLDLLRLLNEHDVPKTAYIEGFDKTEKGITKLKGDLEARMAKEHTEDWDIGVFYGDDPQDGD